MKYRILLALLAGVLLALKSANLAAQTTVTEDFTSGTTVNSWYYFNGACLTAGSVSGGGSPGSVPSCMSIQGSYYNQNLVGGFNGVSGNSNTLPDPIGNGALRLTNGYPYGYAQNGAIVSATPFPAGQGVQVTFKTVTYRGNSGGGAKDGADGISFYLMDGSQTPSLGAWGGSLGYTCSNTNTPYDGLVGGYLGLGIDEYGNFLNQYDNTAPGYGYVPGRIGLRGAGNVSWAYLNANYPAFYPTTLTSAQRFTAVRNTCASGTLWDYSQTTPVQATTNGSTIPVMDYAVIPNAYQVLSGVQIANETAMRRGQANPIYYKLRITQNGLLSLSYSVNNGAVYQQVIKNQSIAASNGPMPATFRFGFAGSTGGSTNIHEILCFQAAPAVQSAASVGVNEKQSAKVETGTQAFFAYYDPSNWTGRVTATSIGVDSSGNVVLGATPTWDASCVLNGVAMGATCDSTGASGPIAAPGPSGRTLLSWNGSNGIPFQYPSLNTVQQSAITQGDATPATPARVNYLRGDRSNEIDSTGAGLFRARDSILGDIVDASPTWVGAPTLPYTGPWKDRLYPAAVMPESTATQNYVQFASLNQTRANVVYVGSNDGLLHGFRAGANNSNGQFSTAVTPNDGAELLGYMPSSVVQNIHNVSNPQLDYSSTQYGHNYFVDATPGTGDLFYNGTWHTWLVGGLGPGGSSIYALDITRPDTAFSESNAANVVMGEWNAATLSCANASGCGNNLGNTFGTPVIRRFHNGAWGFIFGNGIGSASGDAGIFVVTIDPVTQARTAYYLGTGQAGNGDGITYATAADLDGDHVVDYVYAGDLLGNVWRFDLTSSNPGAWSAPTSPLFTTPGGQPITTQVVLASGKTTSGAQRLIVAFGTGRKVPATNTVPTTFASGTQTLYGIWDWNMSAWNTLSSATYNSLSPTGTGLAAPYVVSKSGLQGQTVTINAGNQDRDIAVNATVCWQGASECGSGNNQFGWYLDLPGNGEQIIYNPQLISSAFVVNSTVPAQNSPSSCTVATDQGFTYAVNMLSGGAFKNFFPTVLDPVAAGIKLDATGSSFPVTTASGLTSLIYQTVLNRKGVTPINPPVNSKANRLTWIELR